MREIKFRAWDTQKSKMLYTGKKVHILPFSGEMSGYSIAIKIKGTWVLFSYAGELMQYIGLKDKNGREIYEGDIVTTGDGYGGMPSYDQTKPRLIEFHNGCWCFDAGRYDDGDWIRFGFWTYSNEGKNQLKQLEVIGNIYENPELLE